MSEATRIVIVEDDLLIADYLSQLCTDHGAEVVGTAETADEALQVIRHTVPDFLLMDVRLQGRRDGVDVAMAVHAEHPEIKVVFITGSNEPPTIARIKGDHPYRILLKPIDPDDLLSTVGLVPDRR